MPDLLEPVLPLQNQEEYRRHCPAGECPLDPLAAPYSPKQVLETSPLVENVAVYGIDYISRRSAGWLFIYVLKFF